MATYSEQYRQQHPLPSAPHQAQYQQDQQDQHYQQDQYQDSQVHYQDQYQSQPSQSQYQQPQQSQQQQRQEQQYYPPTSQQQRPPQRPHHTSNKSRTFSFHSQKSHKSSGSKDLIETSAEKEAKRLHSKADPTLAINEAEPSVVAMMTEVSLSPLRSIQHKDALGNAIADPDKSNPTRNRWERPLDTIRSFEAAIDGGYSRKSMIRSDTDSVINFNRRNTFHPTNQPRFPQDTYYNNRPVSLRPDNRQSELGPPRQSFFDGQVYSNGYGAGPSRMRTSRVPTDQYMPQGRDQNIYPLPHKDRSYETVTSAAGSGHSDQNGYQTDPTSSDNSSIDRTSPNKRIEPVNDYGIGFNQTPSYQPQNPRENLGRKPIPQNTQQSSAYPPQQPGPAVPQKQKTIIRRQPSQQSTAQSTLQRPEAPEKRKSWLARRFSKRS